MQVQECSQHFSHCKSMEIFPDAQGQLTPQSLVWSGRILNSFEMLLNILVTCKYEEYTIKNEGARVVTTLYINILDAKG